MAIITVKAITGTERQAICISAIYSLSFIIQWPGNVGSWIFFSSIEEDPILNGNERFKMNVTKRFCIALSVCVSTLTPVLAQNDFIQVAAKEPGAKLTPSGLVYRSLQDGQGPNPVATDKVRVHYRGTFPDGREFDSSYKRNKPIDFPLNAVIPCWTEGVQLMKVGGKAKLTCPAAIAYGARGAGGVIPPNATLQFEVELVAIAGK